MQERERTQENQTRQQAERAGLPGIPDLGDAAMLHAAAAAAIERALSTDSASFLEENQQGGGE